MDPTSSSPKPDTRPITDSIGSIVDGYRSGIFLPGMASQRVNGMFWLPWQPTHTIEGQIAFAAMKKSMFES